LKLTDVLGAVPPHTKALYLFNGQPYNLKDATRDWKPIFKLVQDQSNAIENAFTEENALDADKQSALCAIPTLAEDPKDNFNLYYTDSDQHYHIEGGNDQIATIIAADIAAQLISATALTAIKQLSDGRFRLTFAQSANIFDRVYDRVILALPFSVMRVGVDFSKAGFSALKVKS